MKIGYICNQANCVSGASNGIRMQALIWYEELKRRGHDIVLIDAWGIYDWKAFDIIHAFSFGESTAFLDSLKKKGVKKAVVSPIIDTDKSRFLYKLATRMGSKRLRLSSPGYNLRNDAKSIDMFLARSEYERGYIEYCFDVPVEKTSIVPLSYRNMDTKQTIIDKEPFCLHVSSYTQGRKNAKRLIQAAIKYGFKLVIAGNHGNKSSYNEYLQLIKGHDNITILGFVSDEELNSLYSKAKVFALPSTYEGVGLVALEAAVQGCDIVITNIGGPKEYYASYAYTVNPYSVEDIGMSIVKAINDTKQPMLKNHIENNYNISHCVNKLEQLYYELL